MENEDNEESLEVLVDGEGEADENAEVGRYKS